MKQGSTENTVSTGSVLTWQRHNFTSHVVYYDRLENQNCSWQSNFHFLLRLRACNHCIYTVIFKVNEIGWAGIHALSNTVSKVTPDCSAKQQSPAA